LTGYCSKPDLFRPFPCAKTRSVALRS